MHTAYEVLKCITFAFMMGVGMWGIMRSAEAAARDEVFVLQVSFHLPIRIKVSREPKKVKS